MGVWAFVIGLSQISSFLSCPFIVNAFVQIISVYILILLLENTYNNQQYPIPVFLVLTTEVAPNTSTINISPPYPSHTTLIIPIFLSAVALPLYHSFSFPFGVIYPNPSSFCLLFDYLPPPYVNPTQIVLTLASVQLTLWPFLQNLWRRPLPYICVVTFETPSSCLYFRLRVPLPLPFSIFGPHWLTTVLYSFVFKELSIPLYLYLNYCQYSPRPPPHLPGLIFYTKKPSIRKSDHLLSPHCMFLFFFIKAGEILFL